MQRQFHETKYAYNFFNRQIPEIIRALERLADAAEEHNKLLSKTGGSEINENIDIKE